MTTPIHWHFIHSTPPTPSPTTTVIINCDLRTIGRTCTWLLLVCWSPLLHQHPHHLSICFSFLSCFLFILCSSCSSTVVYKRAYNLDDFPKVMCSDLESCLFESGCDQCDGHCSSFSRTPPNKSCLVHLHFPVTVSRLICILKYFGSVIFSCRCLCSAYSNST